MSVSLQVMTVVLAGIITFVSRAAFLLRPSVVVAHGERSWFGRFLEAFPVALFVSLAVVQALAPDGEPELGPPLVGLAVGAVTAVFTRRLVLIMLVGWVAAMAARIVW